MRRAKVVALAPVRLAALSADATGALAGRSVGGEAQAAVVRAYIPAVERSAASSENASKPDVPEEQTREPDPDARNVKQGGAGPPGRRNDSIAGPDGLEIMIIGDTGPVLGAETKKADGAFQAGDCGKRGISAVDDGERADGIAARDNEDVDGETGRWLDMADGEVPLAVRWQHAEDGDIWHEIPGANNLSIRWRRRTGRSTIPGGLRSLRFSG